MRIIRRLIIVNLLFAVLAASACSRGDGLGNAKNGFQPLVVVAENGEHKFRVEIADDDETRRLGLMYRTEMAPDAGMLFDFGEPQPLAMWMKNTLIPLDLAFIDKDGVIRRITANATPRSLESLPSGSPVIAVLEVNGGVFEKLGIKAGDKVRHKMFSKD